MAEFIDEREATLEEGEEFEVLEETSEEETSTEPEPTPEPSPEENIPDKYKGKSVKDIIAMHQNAESMMGRQSQEVGELRRVVDDFIKSQTVTQQQSPSASTDDSDDDLEFFENPKAAINKMLENHPALKQTKEYAVKSQQQQTKEQLAKAFPNYGSYLKDPKFAEWVGSSNIRTRLLQEPDQNYNYEAAAELFSLWQERTGVVEQAKKNEQVSRKQAIQKGATGSATGTNTKNRKVYRRADIIELMQRDPQRYQAMAEDIRKAYSEGRVR